MSFDSNRTGSPTSTCRQCGEPIRFRETPAGKWQPINADGSVHFASCPARERKAYPADVCIVCGSLAVEIGPGTPPHYAKLRCLSCNAFRWLPWPKDKAVPS